MTPTELLIPRYIVTHDYPNSPFKVGDILTHNKSEVFPAYNKRPGCFVFEHEIVKYPHLFRELSWWMERKVEDLKCIEYVKGVYNNEIYFVGKVLDFEQLNKVGSMYAVFSRHENGNMNNVIGMGECVFIATEQEYTIFKNTKI